MTDGSKFKVQSSTTRRLVIIESKPVNYDRPSKKWKENN